MLKNKRIRIILENDDKFMLPVEYDNALIGIHYNQEYMFPVYTYLALIKSHMEYNIETEEKSLNYIEDNVMSNPNIIIVDDTGV